MNTRRRDTAVTDSPDAGRQPQPVLLNAAEPLPACGVLTLPADLAAPAAGRRRNLALRGLLGALPAEVDLIVAGPAAALSQAGEWPELAARRQVGLVAVPEETRFTIWSQDSFLAARSPADGTPVMVLPARAKRQADDVVARLVADAAGLATTRAALAFEGGNILVGNDFILIGADCGIRQDRSPPPAWRALDPTRTAFVVGTEAAYPRSTVRLIETSTGPMVEEQFGHAGLFQPLFHLDAFISLAGPGVDGRERVLIGDSRMAVAIVNDRRLPGGDQSLADRLDEIARTMAASDRFAVVRNPLPIVPIDDFGLFAWSRRRLQEAFSDAAGLPEVLAAFDRLGRRSVPVRRWRAASQNGGIAFAEGEHAATVILPTYAHGSRRFLAPAERANRELWQRLGYKVVELPDFIQFATENGTAHCLFKVIAAGRDRRWPQPAALSR